MIDIGQNKTVAEKLDALKKRLLSLESAVVAYSGGSDSAFLAKVAWDVLKDKALAVTALSETYPAREIKEASRVAAVLGIRHRTIHTCEFENADFVKNPPNRCYYCKSELFGELRRIADAENFKHVLDGTTADDSTDYRPGRKAAAECGVISPLLEAGFSKRDIRILSERMSIPTWDKPSSACLASRIPYREEITVEKLDTINAAEDFLRENGLGQCRVRHHGNIARIEVTQDAIPLVSGPLRSKIVDRFKALGFVYVALDLAGYRSGSMNDALAPEEK